MGKQKRFMVRLLCSDKEYYPPHEVEIRYVYAENEQQAKSRASYGMCVPLDAREV